MIGSEAVGRARVELANKSHELIELEAAITWGGRAIAAYERYQASGDLHEAKLRLHP